MNCSLCGLPLTLPLVWRGRVFSMEEGPFKCCQPHLCVPPDLPAPNERWFRGRAQKPRKPEQAVAAKVPPTVPAPQRQRRVKTLDIDG